MNEFRNDTSQCRIAKSSMSLHRGVVATMPRSGTWYNNLFFQVYLSLLSSVDALALQDGGLLVDEIPPPNYFGIDHLCICHAACPGFDHGASNLHSLWDELDYYHDGYDRGREYLTSTPGLYDPFKNPHVRIIYCYRNPLDQMVSAFHHSQDHIDEETRTCPAADGKRREFVDFHDYVFNGGLDAYLKQFLTYHWVAPQRPGQVMKVTYEALVRNPLNTFRSMLSFFGHQTFSSHRETLIKQALAMSSMDSIKKMEKTSGKAIANDQISSNTSHIRGGIIGKWRTYLNEQDIEIIEKRLNKFDLGLEMFTLE